MLTQYNIYSVLNFNHNIIFLVEYILQTLFGLNCTTILDRSILNIRIHCISGNRLLISV